MNNKESEKKMPKVTLTLELEGPKAQEILNLLSNKDVRLVEKVDAVATHYGTAQRHRTPTGRTKKHKWSWRARKRLSERMKAKWAKDHDRLAGAITKAAEARRQQNGAL